MADREFTTIGIERRYNPALQTKSREDFIQLKKNEVHDQPPYFRQMERYNQEGSAPPVGRLCLPKPLNTVLFEKYLDNGALALDVRDPEAIGGALIPGSLGIPLDMVPVFAGWFLSYDQDILLIVHDYREVTTAFGHLTRIGYDRVVGFLDEGLHAWEIDGHPYQTIPSIQTRELVRRIQNQEDFILLDVRKKKEFEEGHLPGAVNRYVGKLPEHYDQLPGDKPIVTFCGSGQRAVIAATLLKREGYPNVENCLGSMAACSAVGCPVIRANS
jgi:hydroxyacylglutathione hydrolase